MPSANEEYLPLSFAQQRLWFVQHLSPESTAYNISHALHLEGRLDPRTLELSLNEIVRRHEVLRTTFHLVEGRVLQVIARQQQLTLQVKDFQTFDDPLHAARQFMAGETNRPFDLSRGSLLRTCLLRLGEMEHVLLLTIHHISFDYWSGLVLLGELGALYEAFSAGRPSPLPELPLQYVDFARWQREWLQGEVLENLTIYWKRQLAGASASLKLSTSRPHPPTRHCRGAWLSIALSDDVSRAMRALSLREGATLFMTLLAVFKVLLYRYTGQTDILVGTPTAARNCPELESLIGFFVNMLVLRTDLSGNPSFRDLLIRVREAALGAYAHQDMPLEKLVEDLHLSGGANHQPLFQVVFTHQRVPAETPKPAGLSLTLLEGENKQPKFDLTMLIVEKKETLAISVEYNADVFEAAWITRMLRHYEKLIESVAARPDARIDELEMLTEEEKVLLSKPTDVERLSESFHF